MLGRLRATTDMSAAEWVAAGIGPFGSGVGALLPHSFAAYARILHPATLRDDQPVRWDTIAAWAGRTMHPLVQFSAISTPRPARTPSDPPPWNQPPEEGNLWAAALTAVCEVLARHTTTPDRCWHCLWDGYGWIPGGPAVARLGDPSPVPPAFPPEVLNGPRVRLPNREYLLFSGPLDAALDMGWHIGTGHGNPGGFIPQSPNLLWPDDHAWFAATEIDLDSTFVGGPPALIDAVLTDDRFEAWPAQLTDPVTWDSDTLNR